MVNGSDPQLLTALIAWISHEDSVRSAVLFGSQARDRLHAAAADSLSDIDLHLITDDPIKIMSSDWTTVLPNMALILKVSRAATGGVNKLSLLFSEGEADLVLVPTSRMRLAKTLTKIGLQHKFPRIESALNSFATVMSGGYRFIKGEKDWGSFYARVVKVQPGFRLSDTEVIRIAEDYVYDLLWVIKKLKRGELVAAQRTIHRALLETNIVLLHELRVRQGRVTFQQARRAELLLPPSELEAVTVNSGLDRATLLVAARRNFEGLRLLMGQLIPSWNPPETVSLIISKELTPTAH